MIFSKALSLFSGAQRRGAALVVLLVVVKGLADTIGVASVIPFLSVISNPQSLDENAFLAILSGVIDFDNPNLAVVFLGSTVLGLMFVSAVLRTVATYAIARFTNMAGYVLSRRLLATYLRQPYAYFLGAHSGDMATNILTESGRVVQLVYRPAADLANHGVTFVLLASLLLFADPLVTVAAAVILGGAYLIVFVTVRPIIRRTSSKIVEANKQRFRITQEALSGIKQLKLGGRERDYVERYATPSRAAAECNATNAVLQQSPRFALEFLAFGGIIILTLLLIARYGGVEAGAFATIVPLLGLYAFAGYRLLPALQGIYLASAQLRLGAAPLNQIYEALHGSEALERLPARPPEPMGMRETLEVNGVTFAYPGVDAARPSLQDISVTIAHGETMGIVGGTGAGKTTLTDILLGLLRPQSGEIRVDGVTLDDSNLRRWRASVGYVPQEIFLTDSTVSQNIALGLPPEEIDPAKVERAARMAQIHDFVVSSLPNGYDTLVGERGVRLSGGQRQRIGIARALYNDPDLLVFDEATSALDNLTERELMEEIGALSGAKTVIMIAHRLSTVRACDKIIVLDGGRIVGQGSYDELEAENETFRRLARAVS